MGTKQYRLPVEEIDLSGFAANENNQLAGIVIKARKGKPTPKLTQTEKSILLRYGKPNSVFNQIFEVIDYVNTSPLYISAALGANYKYAGVDVRDNEIVPFGTRTGRVFETFNNSSYSAIEVNTQHTAATGMDGKTINVSGTITTPLPAITSSIQIKVGTTIIPATIDASLNTISGAGILGVGSFNPTNGQFNFDISGTIGSPAYYLSANQITAIDLSVNGTDKKFNLDIDGVLYQNINLGQSSGTTQSDIVNAINTVVGSNVAVASGVFILITGNKASSTFGRVKINPPTSGVSAVALVFDTTKTSISSTNAISPMGYVPKVGDVVVIDYNYTNDVKSSTSFSIFTESPFDDTYESYSLSCVRTTGKNYTLTLYQNQSSDQITTGSWDFSLDRVKDNYGKSLYYEDVFKDNDYIQIFVNSDYTGIAEPSSAIVTMTGGVRGDEPLDSDYLNAWSYFQKKNNYEVKTFLDVTGSHITSIKNLIENYQPQAFGISIVPIGNNAQSAIAYRQDLGIDSSELALYTNWRKIKDPYNNSFAWISGVGAIGVKYAQMNDVYDGLSPAGVNENGIGGQISGFQTIEVENDYSELDKQLLDEAQINPLLKDQFYGVIIDGDKTLQVTNSDTSFIPHVRLQKKMIKDIQTKILRKQVFKLNDDLHRLLAKSQTETYLAPILQLNLLTEATVQCDDGNNDDVVLTNRLFILDIFIKVTPFSEKVLLRITRLPQGSSTADFIRS